MKEKKLVALAMIAVLMAIGNIGKSSVLAKGSVINMDGLGRASLYCYTTSAKADILAYDSGYTVFCRITPYTSDGSVIYGVQDEAYKTASVSYSGTRTLSKATGTFRIVNKVTKVIDVSAG